MLYNRAQLTVKTLCNKLRNRVAIDLPAFCPCDTLEILLRTVNFRSKSSRGYRNNIGIYPIGYHICICYDNFISLFFSKISKFFKHFFCCSEIKRRLMLSIFHLHTALLKNTSENSIRLIHKVNIAGSYNRYSKLFAKLNDFFVKLLKVFNSIICRLFGVTDKKFIVSDRLNFKIVVKSCYLLYVLPRTAFLYSIKNLSRFTGTSEDKTLTVLYYLGNRYSRFASIIFKIAERNKLIKIFQTYCVLYKNYLMIHFQKAWVNIFYALIYLGYFCYFIFIDKTLDKLYENTGKHFGIIYCTVMVKFTQLQLLCNAVKLMT